MGGGDGANCPPGGGGGGGLYGGGGGGSGEESTGGGGGGGGGSSGFGTGATGTSIGADTTGIPSITLSYTPPQTQVFALTVSTSGSGSGTVTSTDGQINCGPTCSHSYAKGTSVTLNASAASGSTFSGWSGAGCTGTGSCTVAMTAAQSVTATFAAIPPPPPNTTPPNTKIGKAKINSRKHQATFTFKATGSSSGFQCALVSKKHQKPKFARCRSPKTYKKLKRGKYSFEVRAVGAGGRDQSPAKKRFAIK
ncbi:MAG: InlB B-repeat-containing protein [Gaiellaceae bacterium]